MNISKLGELRVRMTGGTDGLGGGSGPVVVLLHGFGAPGTDLVGLAPALHVPAGTRFVFPEAPIDLGPRYAGGRAWWPIDLEERMRRRMAGVPRDPNEIPEGLDEARAKLDGMLDEVERTMAPPPGGLVIGGFSQGSMLALDAALRSERRLAGLVLLSTTRFAWSTWKARLVTRATIPMFQSHGTCDDILEFDIAKALHDDLVAAGARVQWVPFSGGHGIPSPVLQAVGEFVTSVVTQGSPT